jgi:hypothetical protein
MKTLEVDIASQQSEIVGARVHGRKTQAKPQRVSA